MAECLGARPYLGFLFRCYSDPSYLLFTKLIRDDLDELRQQVQALQPATPPAETPRKPRH